MFDWTILTLLIVGSMICIATFLIGLSAGGILAERRFRTAISVAFKAVVRSRKKAWFGPKRTYKDGASVPATHQMLRSLSRTERATNADPQALAVARHFKESLGGRFGDRLKAVYLFGSRARGDHSDNSDVDVAVFLVSGPETPELLQRMLIHDACLLLLTHGLYIQPCAFDEDSLKNLDTQQNRSLLYSIIREGVFV
jgi:predicted nucleotidyltransferase